MRAIALLFFATFAVELTAHSTAAAQRPANAGTDPSTASVTVRITRDLPYEKVGGKQLTLDIFSPPVGPDRHPALVFVTNGSFSRSVKSWFSRHATRLAELGFVCATIETQTTPEAHFPAPLNDVQAAIRWMHSHAAEFDVDTTRIGVVGASTGGYIAAAIGTNAWSGHDWSGTPLNLRVRTVVAFNPVSDLPPLARTAPAGPNIATFLGHELADAPDSWRDASVVAHITSNAAPFLLFHGTSDKVVPYRQSVELKQRLEAVGVSVELFTAGGADHGFANTEPWFSPTLAKMEEFLRKTLR